MRDRIDTFEVNKRADLLSLANGATALERKASTGGGEWKGPCPFCGGKDRFSIQPYHQPYGIWMCRNCTDGKWKDAIEFGRRLWPGLKFPELCERLAGGSLIIPNSRRPEPETPPAAMPPSLEWQQAGKDFVEACERELWGLAGVRALEYLHNRGLKNETIKHFHLGFNSVDHRLHFPGLDLPENEKIFIDRGVVIPCFHRDQLWYIKVRRAKDDPKYRLIKGSKPASIFNAEMLDTSDMCLFVEGEFDCMLAWQEFGDLVPVATLGAATNRPDLAIWGWYFYNKKSVMLCYDMDEPGDKGAAALAELTNQAMLAPLPDGPWKDVTDFYKAGGNLRNWIIEYLRFYDPLPGSSDYPLVEQAQALGGVILRDLPPI